MKARIQHPGRPVPSGPLDGLELPCDDDVERTALGAVIVDNEGLAALFEVLPLANEWGRHRHQLIYQAIRSLAERGEAVDLLTLKNQLAMTGMLEDAGGVAYLAGLVDGVPRAMNVRHYASIVRGLAARRELVRLAADVIADPRGIELEVALSRVRSVVASAATPSQREWTPYPLGALPAALRRLVEEGATAIGGDPSYVAVPLVAVLASCIGNSRRIQLK